VTDLTNSIIESGQIGCKSDSIPENNQVTLDLGCPDAPARKRWILNDLGFSPDLHIPGILSEPLFTLYRLTRLKMTERVVLQALLLHAHYANLAEPVFPSMERISAMIGRGVCTVSTALRNLVQAGYIVRQVRRKAHGRYRGVTHTYFTPMLAELVQMPYLPQAVRQKSLFEQAMSGLKQAYGFIAEKLDVKQWTASWFRQRESVANSLLLQKLSLPVELLFLLERGVLASDLFHWQKELRKNRASLDLSGIVTRKRFALEKAKNVGGYLRTLVRKVLNGEKIQEGWEWEADQQQEPEKPLNINGYYSSSIAISADWEPSKVFVGMAKRAGLKTDSPDYPKALQEFVAYWSLRPDETRSQCRWEKSLIFSWKRYLARGHEPGKPDRKKHVSTRHVWSQINTNYEEGIADDGSITDAALNGTTSPPGYWDEAVITSDGDVRYRHETEEYRRWL
jgi:Predicted transcriptional regulator